MVGRAVGAGALSPRDGGRRSAVGLAAQKRGKVAVRRGVAELDRCGDPESAEARQISGASSCACSMRWRKAERLQSARVHRRGRAAGSRVAIAWTATASLSGTRGLISAKSSYVVICTQLPASMSAVLRAEVRPGTPSGSRWRRGRRRKPLER